MIRSFLIGSATALFAACQAIPGPPPPPPAADECAILGSSDWSAWTDAMPGPNANPRLVVTGKVTVPTGGYRFEWGDFRVAESYPVQIFGDLRAIPPAEGATQAVTTHAVRGEWPISPPVGSLSISCGSRLLARIAPVETAH
ncbi:MAG: hypothetical protein ACLGHC_04785 [Alphaproteobacteria bacterium]